MWLEIPDTLFLKFWNDEVSGTGDQKTMNGKLLSKLTSFPKATKESVCSGNLYSLLEIPDTSFLSSGMTI
ncbi:hypothetical protein OH492_24100 [Vibrio chagasii]|nr:hypothetical protein [Vibrio chagasii]